MTTKLIGYEIKKIFSLSYVKKLFALLFIVNLVLCAFYANNNRNVPIKEQNYIDRVYSLYENDPKKFYSELERLQRERENSSITDPIPTPFYGYEGYPDLVLFHHVNQIIESNSLYHEKIESLVQQTQGLKYTYARSPLGKASFGYRYQTQIEKIYSGLNESVVLPNRQIMGWNELFSYHSDYFLVLIFIGVIAILTAHGDKKSGFYQIAGICYYGRKASAFAKYIALLLVSVSTLILFAIGNMAVIGVFCGYSSPGIAAQSVSALELFPLGCSVSTAYLYALALRILAVLLFASTVLTVSVMCRSFSAGAAAGALIAFFSYYLGESPLFAANQWCSLNLWSLYRADQFIIRYRAVNLFCYSVDLRLILLFLFAAATITSLLLTLFCYPLKGRVFRQKHRSLKRLSSLYQKTISLLRKKGRIKSLSPIFYEFKKNMPVCVLFLVLIFIKIPLTSDYYRYDESSYDRNYKQYIAQIGGVYSEEKRDYLEAELTRCSEAISQYSEREKQFINNEISSSQFNFYLKEYNSAQIQTEVLKDLIQRADYLRNLHETKGISGSFVYDTGYNRVIAQNVDWILIFLVCLLSCRSYSVEFKKTSSGSSFYAVIQTTAQGREHLFGKKSLFCFCCAGIFAVLFRAIDCLYWFSLHEVPDFSARLVSMPAYSHMPGSLNIGAYLILTNTLSFFGTVILSVLCFCLAVVIHKMLAAYTVTFLAITAPFFIANTGIKPCRYIDLTLLCNTERMFRQFPLWYCAIFCIALALASAVLYRRSYRKIREGI